MSERYKVAVTKENIVCTTNQTVCILATISLYLTSKNKSGICTAPINHLNFYNYGNEGLFIEGISILRIGYVHRHVCIMGVLWL